MKTVWERFREMQAGCLQRLEQGLAAAIAKGQLPASLDAHRTAVGLHALVNGLISKWVMDPKAMPAKGDAGQLIDIFLDGLRRSPATKPRLRRAPLRRKPVAASRRRAA
jgi:TetR/AcrR family acrAB operon transcriptional repressor